MSAQMDELLDEVAAELNTIVVDADIQVRNLAKREVDVRLAPYDVTIDTIGGPEVMTRGAFAGMAPDSILLMGLEHEVHLGIGQDGKVVPVRRPMGRSISVDERTDAGYATVRVAKTAAGDEFLALADDGVIRGISVEMGRNARIRREKRNGRMTNVVEYADVRAISPTYHPAYADAQVLAVRAQEEDAPVATEDTAPDTGATAEAPAALPVVAARADFDPQPALDNLQAGLAKITDIFGEKLERLEERARMSFEIPGELDTKEKQVTVGQWMTTVLKILTGERIPDAQARATQDFVTTDNAGVVPDAFSDRLIGVIDPRRPFMATTTRIDMPQSGMQLVVPKITQRPTVAIQSSEKALLSSQKSIIGTESFDLKTYGGVGDLSIQLLKKSDPSFLELYLRLLAEAYAIETEEAAVAALITAVNDGGPEPAIALDPDNLNLGTAFQTSFSAIRTGPDTIWLSSEAVAMFINSKATGTNAPLYSNLAANFTAAGGVGGTIQGLRAVHVPALDAKGAYAIVGPSSGFAWAEDSGFTLQVDVPSKAGRDVAFVNMVYFVPWYPEAFTLYNVAS